MDKKFLTIVALALVLGALLGLSLPREKVTVTITSTSFVKPAEGAEKAPQTTLPKQTAYKPVNQTTSYPESNESSEEIEKVEKKKKEVKFNYWTDVVDGIAYLFLNVSGEGALTASLAYPSGKLLDSESFFAPSIVKLKLCHMGRGYTPIFGRYLLTLGDRTYNVSFTGPNVAFNTMKFRLTISSGSPTLTSFFAVIDNRGDLPAIAKKFIVEVDGKGYEYRVWVELPVRRTYRFSKNLGIALTPTKHKVRVRLLDQKCSGDWKDLIVVVKDFKGPKLVAESFGVKVERTQSGDVVKWIKLQLRNLGDLPVVIDQVVVESGSKYSFPISPVTLEVKGKGVIELEVNKPASNEVKVYLYSGSYLVATFSKKA